MKARKNQPTEWLPTLPLIVALLLGVASLAWSYATLLDSAGGRSEYSLQDDRAPFRISPGLDAPRFRHTGENLLYRQTHRAHSFLEDALRQDPHNATLWLRLAQSYFYSGDPARGSRMVLHSLQLAPAYVPIQLEQAAMAVDFWQVVDPPTRQRWERMVETLYEQQPKLLIAYLHSSDKLSAACAQFNVLVSTPHCSQKRMERRR